MPVEDDIHGPGMFDDLGFAVDLNVVRAVKLVPVNQQGDPRIASYVLDLVGRITRSNDHLCLRHRSPAKPGSSVETRLSSGPRARRDDCLSKRLGLLKFP